MLSNISWTNYIFVVLLLLVVYYIFIGAKFYSQEIKDLLAGRNKLFFLSSPFAVSVQDDEEPHTVVQPVKLELFESETTNVPASEEKIDVVKQIKELTNSLKEAIAEAVEKNYIKEEFILSLQIQLKKYSFLKGSPSVAAINNLIASECEKYGYLQLSAEERMMLWNE